MSLGTAARRRGCLARRCLSLVIKALLLVGVCDASRGQVQVSQEPVPAQPNAPAPIIQSEGATEPAPSMIELPADPGTPADNPGTAPVDDSLFLELLLNEEAVPILNPDDIYPLPETMPEEEPGLREITAPSPRDGRIEGVTPETWPNPVMPSGLNAIGVPVRNPVWRNSINQALSTSDAILSNLSGVRGALPAPFLPRSKEPVPLLRLGPVLFRPFLSVGVAAGHSSRNGDEAGGFFQAGFEAVLQQQERLAATLDYTIGIMPSVGGSSGTGDGLDQYIAFDTRFSFSQWPKVKFGFALDYAGLSNVNRDVGSEVERILATAEFAASYEYSKKTTFELGLVAPIRQFSGATSSAGGTASFFVNNQVTRKTRVGLGFAVGMLRAEGGSEQWFEQALVRVSYRPSAFWTFEGTAGLELSEWEGSTHLHPIFGLGLVWEPRLGTTVELVAESRLYNSATSQNTDYRSTAVILGVRQRIGYRLTASASIGYEHAEYENRSIIRPGRDGRRRDDMFQASAGLSLPITHRWNWALTFSAGENDSNVRSFDFYQVVLQTSYSF